MSTGARAAELQQLLARIGVTSARSRPPAPRLERLTPAAASNVLDLYRVLGGVLHDPALRPGPWDLACIDDLVIELDEELHFNRYRALRLDGPWAVSLPWTAEYIEMCRAHESACLAAGR